MLAFKFMELRHLRYFLAVAEEENITRAADRLHISQPPLSRQIRDLEDELGVELFQRTARSIHLTEAGKCFVPEARAVLLRVDEAVQKVRATSGLAQETIHVGYAPSPTGDFISRILEAYKKAVPDGRVVLHDMTSREMLAGIRHKKLHAALLVEHAVPPRDLRFHRLRSYPVGVIFPKNHRLSKRRRLRTDEIRDEPTATLSQREYADYHAWLRRILGKTANRLRWTEECDGALSLIAAVESGRAIAISAESIMSIAGSRVAFVRLSPAPEPLHVGICYPSEIRPGSPTAVFVEAARSVISD